MKGVDFMQLKKAEREESRTQSSRFTEQIGSTLYRVSVCFPKAEDVTSNETLEEKITRLIRNDLQFHAGHGIMNILQTGRLPERGAV
jgi:hypothetical protein